MFNKEFLKIRNIYYFECKNNDIYKNKKKIIYFKKLKKINYKFENSEFFISSFQYMTDLNKILKKYNNQSKIFLPYDSSSRSLIDYYYIKKYKGKNKIYSKEIY